jgi:tetratricopeptide (TPR) repeat protein
MSNKKKKNEKLSSKGVQKTNPAKGKQQPREKTSDVSPKAELSSKKKRVFWIVTIVLPFLLLLILEIGLRIFDYGGNIDLFIEGPPGYENYLRCNPNVARRYFYTQSTIPTPPTQLFLKVKPKNGYRIFVLGESSAAGFPYGTNASFPNILERALANAFPEKNIEVISIAMAAINSYTLLDLVDEIMPQKPDALLIYTGHNEYYGALGVGSVQSLGNSRWLINTYLKLQSFRIFLLLRDFIGWIKNVTSEVLYEGSEVDPTATMMERIVGEQTIPYGSSLYEDGKKQFKENMDEILRIAADNNVKVVLSELVSNVKDQKPFISIKDNKGNSAEEIYKLAKQFEAKGDFQKAKEYYIKAKDLDALRFRAPEEFNFILKELANKYRLPIVPMVTYFEQNSPNGLIGNSLMLEHLHPNKDGYFLIAKAFYETMRDNHIIKDIWPEDCISREKNQGLTELDSVYALIVIRHLKGSWPFQPKGLPNRFAQNFKSANHIEEIAFRILPSDNYNLISGHTELGDYYQKQGELDKAFAEYNTLVTSIPYEPEFYRYAATVLITQKKYDKAYQLLLRSLKYKESLFANKWIGQIAFMKNNFEEAISYLLRADLSDDQVVFNLSRTFYHDNQWDRGEEYYQRLKNLAPKSEYVAYLNNLRIMFQMKQRTLKSK